MNPSDPWSLTEAALREPWRLWTGHLSHWSWGHALANLLALFVPLALLEAQARRRVLFGLCVLAPLLALGLLPFLAGAPYRGASGLASALWAVVGMTLVQQGKATRGPGLGLLTLLMLKLILEFRGAASPFLEAWHSLPWAHGLGTALGLVWAFSRPGRPTPPQPPDTAPPAPSGG